MIFRRGVDGHKRRGMTAQKLQNPREVRRAGPTAVPEFHRDTVTGELVQKRIEFEQLMFLRGEAGRQLQ